MTFFGTIGLTTLALSYFIFHNLPATALSTSLELPPYFSYSPTDIQFLNTLTSDKVITDAEVDHWVQVVFDLVKKIDKKFDATRVYAYFFAAQRDAAALSYQTKKKLAGNLTAISTKTLCLLLPDKCSSIPPAEESDAYSIKIAEIVSQKIAQRFEAENKALDAASTSTPPKEWAQDKAYFGLKIGYQTPWLITASNQFRLENPKEYGFNEIKAQKEELQKILSSVTKQQIEIAQKWTAGTGTILTSGQWLELANNYMSKHNTPLVRSIFVRSILAMGVADATITYYDTKFTYWQQRPSMLFPELKTNLKTPNQPSYPSGHATLSMAAAIIMDHYFPENQAEWDSTANEIGQSRLWGGVHFPIDDHDGLELGRKIGDWIIKKLES